MVRPAPQDWPCGTAGLAQRCAVWPSFVPDRLALGRGRHAPSGKAGGRPAGLRGWRVTTFASCRPAGQGVDGLYLRDPFCRASAKEHLPPPTPVERTTATDVGGRPRVG